MSSHRQTFGDLIYGLVWSIVLAGLLSLQAPPSHAQQGEFSLPQRWQVSPDNTKEVGETGYEAVTPNGLAMVWVPGDKFMMGSTAADVRYAVRELGEEQEWVDDEQPAHELELDGFWVGKTEVTVAQWRAVMGSVPEQNNEGDDHPVAWVSWDECQEFCEKTGLSLPTEAQWEYAARGPERRRYPWGDEWDPKRLCWWENRGPGDSTFAVGSVPEGASWCGALDMAGNVLEWCADWYDEDYYRQSPRRDPVGPATGTYRVLRGGCWGNDAPRHFRCANRHLPPAGFSSFQGFRCTRGFGGGG
jgi:formylglycine-generating enzyme required for sulfatase activity